MILLEPLKYTKWLNDVGWIKLVITATQNNQRGNFHGNSNNSLLTEKKKFFGTQSATFQYNANSSLWKGDLTSVCLMFVYIVDVL